jgi:hypothetical protein
MIDVLTFCSNPEGEPVELFEYNEPTAFHRDSDMLSPAWEVCGKVEAVFISRSAEGQPSELEKLLEKPPKKHSVESK